MSEKGKTISTGYWNKCISIDENTGEKTFQTHSLYGVASDREFNDGTNLQQLKDQLDIGDKCFVFDYQDGQYGYNTDVNRGADTFCSFGVNQLRFDLKSYYKTANYGSEEDYENIYTNHITLPLSIIESVTVGGGVDGHVYHPDGNEEIFHRIIATQIGSTNSKRIKSTTNNWESLKLTEEDFEDIAEYPYLQIEAQVNVNYSGYYDGGANVIVNLK